MKRILHRTVVSSLIEAKFRSREFRGSLQTSVLKSGTSCRNRKLDPQ